jgi:hypothetical protein
MHQRFADKRVLQQNPGRQAAVLNVVRRARAAPGDTLVAVLDRRLHVQRVIVVGYRSWPER